MAGSHARTHANSLSGIFYAIYSGLYNSEVFSIDYRYASVTLTDILRGTLQAADVQ